MPGGSSLTWRADLSRVLLIGRGPLPHPGQLHCSFPQLRTLHFAQALQATGADLRILLLTDGDPRSGPSTGWAGQWTLQEEGPGWLEAAEELSSDADLLVSAGPYNPGRLACLIAGERPVWADIPGDPLAEHQALAAAIPDLTEERRAAAHSALLPVLCRADALSTISERQRLATIGQLHLLGRRPAQGGAPVHSVPIALNFPFEAQSPHDSGPVRVVMAGGLNCWLDHETLIDGLREALKVRPEMEFHCIGGPIAGMNTGAWSALEAWALEPQTSAQIHLHGWVAQHRIPEILGQCHAGIWMDRPGDEPLLGSRTRALLYGWMGLQIVASTSTELAVQLRDAGHMQSIPVGDSRALSQALCVLQPERRGLSDARRAWMQAQYSVESSSQALCRWVQDPKRVVCADTPSARIAADHARLRDELSSMRATPTWRLLSAAHRALGRRES
jgi:glycosyltransferase involved in cell wall biosynthesis